MFLQHKPTGALIEVMELEEMSDPNCDGLVGRSHAGEELQDPETYPKSELIFPSGESLPRCWIDPEYKNS